MQVPNRYRSERSLDALELLDAHHQVQFHRPTDYRTHRKPGQEGLGYDLRSTSEGVAQNAVASCRPASRQDRRMVGTIRRFSASSRLVPLRRWREQCYCERPSCGQCFPGACLRSGPTNRPRWANRLFWSVPVDGATRQQRILIDTDRGRTRLGCATSA